jgi:hypothetical protein
MARFLPRLALAASTVSALLVASQCPAVAAPTPPRSYPAVPAPRHSRAAVPAPLPATGTVNLAKETLSATRFQRGKLTSCTPVAKGDYVHISSTPPATASGHGWWDKGNCTATRAVVSIVLQEYFSDGSWRDRGQGGQGTYRPGGGASHRATARAVCQTTTTTGWRSVVNVSVVGESGTASVTTPARDINCRVP